MLTEDKAFWRREKNLFLGAWKKKTGKLSLSYMVHSTFPSEKHRQAYTLEDCSQLVGRCRGVDEAEEALIKLYRPCLNTDANPNPTPLPVPYKSRGRYENAYGDKLTSAKNAHAGKLSKLFHIK